METNFNPAGDIMGELYLEGGGGGGVVTKKKGTPGGRVASVMVDYGCKSS